MPSGYARPMRITVHGHHRLSRSPELGRLHLRVEAAAAHREEAIGRAQSAAAELSGRLRADKKAGRVVEYAVQSPSTHVEHVRDQDGTPTAVRHRVSVAVTAVFTEAETLGERVSGWALHPDVELGWVDWELTEDTRRAFEETALAEAVADARRRAQVLATAAGAGEVRVLEVADPGMLSGGADASRSGAMGSMRAYAANGGHGGDGFAVVPEDVTVEAAVDVRCEA